MKFVKSNEAFAEAKKYIPGGVNSPVRAFRSVNVNPPFIAKGKGSKIYDIDGNEYIDYVGSWGPLILGHCDPDVSKALKEVVDTGISFGAPTTNETELAKLVCELVPSVEVLRMVNSGTEATMSAIRLARAYTNRELIVKFIGNYHGHSDSLLVKAGSGALTHGVPDSPGVPADLAKNTISANYNDVDDLKKIFADYKDQIAGVIFEPIAGNMGVVPASKEFMSELRRITKENGALLICDEVMTGFRVSLHCAQSLYGLDPDITCFGKILGGGMPAGAYGGKSEFMRQISPDGPVYQAGTLSGNPMAVTAGLVTLNKLKDNPSIYEELEKKAKMLEAGFTKNAEELGVNVTINRVGSMVCPYFTDKPVNNFDDAMDSDLDMFSKYFEEMLKQGVYLAPSQFEASFISDAHSVEDINKTIEANYKALKALL